jgi:hypothetical protein
MPAEHGAAGEQTASLSRSAAAALLACEVITHYNLKSLSKNK